MINKLWIRKHLVWAQPGLKWRTPGAIYVLDVCCFRVLSALLLSKMIVNVCVYEWISTWKRNENDIVFSLRSTAMPVWSGADVKFSSAHYRYISSEVSLDCAETLPVCIREPVLLWKYWVIARRERAWVSRGPPWRDFTRWRDAFQAWIQRRKGGRLKLRL